MQKVWTKEEEIFLEENYRDLSIQQLEIQLNRSAAGIKCKARKLCLYKRKYWSEQEEQYLWELLGDYPWQEIPRLYNLWTQKNGFVPRAIEQIENKIIRHKKSRRLDASSEYFTTTDLSFLLGCDRHTSARLFKTYRQKLKPQGEFKKGSSAYVSRRSLKKWLINNQNVVERYRSTIDLVWYTDIISR